MKFFSHANGDGRLNEGNGAPRCPINKDDKGKGASLARLTYHECRSTTNTRLEEVKIRWLLNLPFNRLTGYWLPGLLITLFTGHLVYWLLVN